MRNMLLAGVAVAGLALAPAALAQVVDTPVQATPPVAAPQTEPEVSSEDQVGTGVIDQQTQAGAAPASPLPQAPAAEAPAMAADATPQVQHAAPQPASATQVCQPRVTSVHFGARGGALSRDNENAIEHAVDAASVCDLQQVTITNSTDGRLASRRAAAVRATLIAQGVPAEAITVEETANAEGAATGQLDVRMSFAGVAQADGAQAALPSSPAS